MAKKRSVRVKRDTRRYHSGAVTARFDSGVRYPKKYRPDRYTFALRSTPTGPTLDILEDHRVWSPVTLTRRRTDMRPARVVSRGAPPPPGMFPSISAKVGFDVPDKVITCVRRKSRREVIFATGRQGGGPRKARSRRNEASNLEC